MAELRDKALQAVEEAARAAGDGPVERTAALRFALAFLANFADDRRPFDLFWREIARAREENYALRFGRTQTIDNLAAVIHRAVGCERAS